MKLIIASVLQVAVCKRGNVEWRQISIKLLDNHWRKFQIKVNNIVPMLLYTLLRFILR